MRAKMAAEYAEDVRQLLKSLKIPVKHKKSRLLLKKICIQDFQETSSEEAVGRKGCL